MMDKTGVGKGMNIKGKSGKAPNLINGYVPFLQTTEESHKRKFIKPDVPFAGGPHLELMPQQSPFSGGTPSQLASGGRHSHLATLQHSPLAGGPILLAHGVGGRGEIDSLQDGPIKALVSSGFIVIAPYTNVDDSNTCKSTLEYKDVLRAIQVSETDTTLHKALPRVNWARIGVWGNSMGAKTTPLVVKKSPDDRIKAMVCAYGARSSNGVADTPSMYITGTKDRSSSPADLMKREFDSNPAKQKIFLNLEGVDHMENLMDDWLAKFFACHVGQQDTCDQIYGSDPAICHAASFAQSGCIVDDAARRLIAFV